MKRILCYMICGAIGMISACNRDNLAIPHGSDYTQVYMPQAHQYPNLQNVFVLDSPQVITCNAFFGGPSSPGTPVEVSFAVDTTLVDSFNLQNNTHYPVMPAGSYALDSPDAVIAAHQLSSSSLRLTILPAGLQVNQSYLLPLRISRVGGGYRINAGMGTTYYLISGAYPPGEVVPWNDFNLIMSYGNDWIVRKSDGTLRRYPTDAAGNFGPPAEMAQGWGAYDLLVNYGNAIITRKPNGDLLRFPIQSDKTLGAPEQIGQGWDVFSVVFAYKGALITIRKDNGALWRYPLDSTGAFGFAGQIGQGWNGINTIFGSSNALIALIAGNLWQYPLDADGNFDYGNIRQIGQGWDIFNLFFYDTKDNAVVVRKPDGTLWRYPLDANGNPGAAQQIGK